MKPSLACLSDFQILMLGDGSNEIPSQVLNSMPLSQYKLTENQPEALPIRVYPLVA